MKLFYKLMRKDPGKREDVISVTSMLGIVLNLLIAAVKVIIGILSASVAILSEGANNATDALASVLTLVGVKLAGRHPDKKHPFGYGRIEYLTGLVIGAIITFTGVEMLISSFGRIFTPEKLEVSYLSVIIVGVTAVIKLFHGIYTVKMGKKASSEALIGVGKESKNDCLASALTIVATLVYILFHISLDAYAGIIISGLIIKAGAEVLLSTCSELIGRPGEKNLADKIYEEIRRTDGVLRAADMMLHNYGPDAYSGSVNLEFSHEKTVGEIYQVLHELQLRIMHTYRVTMVFGIYAVDEKSEDSICLRRHIGTFTKRYREIKSFHAVYLNPKEKRIYCDFIVDYSLRDWEGLKAEFTEYMKPLYPDMSVELTVETEFI